MFYNGSLLNCIFLNWCLRQYFFSPGSIREGVSVPTLANTRDTHQIYYSELRMKRPAYNKEFQTLEAYNWTAKRSCTKLT